MLDVQVPWLGPQLEERRLPKIGMRYLLAIPDGWDGERLLVGVHGISRNWREHAQEFLSACAARRVALVAPRFSKQSYHGYQRLAVGRSGLAADEALVRVLADFQVVSGAERLAVALFGFSGGAQFAHRFVLAHPGLVARLAIASAGFYSFPDPAIPFPYGIAPVDGGPALDVDGLDLPLRVYVGSQDTERDEDLRQERELDRRQGRDRVVRARRFAIAVRGAMAMRGRRPDCSFEVLPGCGHSFDDCVATGDLARRATAFLFPDRDDSEAVAAPRNPRSITLTPAEDP